MKSLTSLELMKFTLLLTTIFAFPNALSAQQEPENKSEKLYPNTPLIPGSVYTVHDTTRPQPRKVQSKGAINITAPSDAKVLFDGSSIEAWTGNWKVKDGILIASPGSLTTKETFRDCQLHIEFRVPPNRKVSGQNGSNSGIFLMDLYEVQVCESHTNITYPDGQAGAIYGQYPPLVNPATAQGEWQSYDIIFKAPIYENGKVTKPAQITVLFNGIVVQAAQDVLGPTRHKVAASYPRKHAEQAPIRLQWHQDPIEFRNIWVRELRQ